MNFSIVIPLYNKEKYIERCLTSILFQTLKPFEVIIINDGSTDSGPNIIRNNFSQDNIIFLTQQNSGVSNARNAGVAVANGDWVAFLDADDYWEDNYLLEISNLINRFPYISLCATGYQFHSNNINKVAKINIDGEDDYRILSNYFLSSCKGDLPITASSVVIKKSDFLAVGGFPDGWVMGEDIYLWMKMAINYKLAVCMKTLVTYDHSDENSATKKNRVLDILPHVDSLESWLQNGEIPEPLKKDAEILLHRSYVYTAFQNIKYGNKQKASTLITSPNVFNGWHKLAIRILTICPDWLTKRLN